MRCSRIEYALSHTLQRNQVAKSQPGLRSHRRRSADASRSLQIQIRRASRISRVRRILTSATSKIIPSNLTTDKQPQQTKNYNPSNGNDDQKVHPPAHKIKSQPCRRLRHCLRRILPGLDRRRYKASTSLQPLRRREQLPHRHLHHPAPDLPLRCTSAKWDSWPNWGTFPGGRLTG